MPNTNRQSGRSSGSTLDRATYMQYKTAPGGGWAALADLGDFIKGRYTAMADTPEKKAEAEVFARGKTERVKAAMLKNGFVNPTHAFGDDHMAYDLDAGDRLPPGYAGETVIRKNDPDGYNVQVMLRNGSRGVRAAAEESLHAHITAILGGEQPKDRMKYLLTENEVVAAKSNMNPWAWAKYGYTPESAREGSIKQFWADHIDEWNKSGKSAREYTEGLDMPDNAKEAIENYLLDTPGFRDAYDSPETWDTSASTGTFDMSRYAAEKAGHKKTTGGQIAGFLATDKVPPTLFGIPVIARREEYTEADIRFFQEHPEAGGYYDVGDDREDAGQYNEPGTDEDTADTSIS